MIAMDMLEKIFNAQGELINLLGYDPKTPAMLKEILACMSVEVAEAQAPLLNSTKPWKVDRPIDWAHIDEEVVDVLHFVMGYFIGRDYTAEQIFDLYYNKNSANRERIAQKLNKN